jgi:hypothetical protein
VASKCFALRIAEFLQFGRPVGFRTAQLLETGSVAVLRRKGGQAPTVLVGFNEKRVTGSVIYLPFTKGREQIQS